MESFRYNMNHLNMTCNHLNMTCSHLYMTCHCLNMTIYDQNMIKYWPILEKSHKLMSFLDLFSILYVVVVARDRSHGSLLLPSQGLCFHGYNGFSQTHYFSEMASQTHQFLKKFRLNFQPGDCESVLTVSPVQCHRRHGAMGRGRMIISMEKGRYAAGTEMAAIW